VQVRVQNSGNARWARKVQINDHLCSVRVEEDPNDYLRWGCKETSHWDDYSDSVSSSETYVEETAFSVRSGEEHNRFSGDDRRSVGEEVGGEKVGEGEHPWQNSTFSVLEPGKGGQGKGRIVVSSNAGQRLQEQDGSFSAQISDQACGGASCSNPILYEAAKAVIDVECLSTLFLPPSKVVGRAKKF